MEVHEGTHLSDRDISLSTSLEPLKFMIKNNKEGLVLSSNSLNNLHLDRMNVNSVSKLYFTNDQAHKNVIC